jgi:outer membrane protein TolC
MRFFSSLLSLTLLSALLASQAGAQTEAQAPTEAAAPAPAQDAAQAPVTGDSTVLNPPALKVDGENGHELTINDAIQRAMTRSYSVAGAQAAREAQREAARGAISRVGPSGTVTYNETRFEDAQVANFNGNPITIRGDRTKTGSIIVTQPITGLYGYIENARASDLQEEISEEGLKKARADAGFAGAQAFLDAYAAQEQVVIAQASVASAQSAFNDANVQNRVGRINQADFLKFQLNLSQSQSRLAQARARQVISIAVLRQTLQMPDSEAFYLNNKLPEPRIDPIVVDAAVQEALKNRPDLKQSEKTAEFATFNTKLATTEFIPTVELFAQMDRNFGEITALGNPDKDVKYYGVKMQWNFWNNGASVFKIRESMARTRLAESQYATVKDNVRLDVIQAVQNLQASQESLKQAEVGIKQAEEAYRIDQVRYKSGGITASDRILSESTKSSVQGDFVTARTALLSWYFKLQQALGKENPTL